MCTVKVMSTYGSGQQSYSLDSLFPGTPVDTIMKKWLLRFLGMADDQFIILRIFYSGQQCMDDNQSFNYFEIERLPHMPFDNNYHVNNDGKGIPISSKL